MAKYEGLSILIAAITAGITIFVSALRFVPFPWKYPASVVSVVVFLFVLLYFHFYVKTDEEKGKASLETHVLPFYKGFPIPPSPAEKILNSDGSITYRGRNDRRTTTEEVKYLADSQLLAVWFGKIDEEKKEFIAKFGVLRIRSIIGDIKECHVGVKYRVIGEMGVSRESKWHDGGYLNWFSILIKRDMGKYNLLENISNGINKYLKNERNDIYQGEEKDLLLFYVVKGSPMVHLCSTLDFCQIGVAMNEDMPLMFELRLTIVGEGLVTVEKLLKISAAWDDFKIEEVGLR